MFGHFIVKAVFLQLMEDHQINKPETKVISIYLIADGIAIVPRHAMLMRPNIRPKQLSIAANAQAQTLFGRFEE